MIQTKLKVGEPNDQFEQEADSVAAEVMRMPECAGASSDDRRHRVDASGTTAATSIQRLCAECSEEEEPQPTSSLNTPTVQRTPRLSSPPTIQRACVECAAENDKKLRRKPLSPAPLAAALNGPSAARFKFPDATSAVHRLGIEDEDEGIRRKAVSGTEENGGYREAAESTPELTTGGSPLSHSLRTFYESRFGYNLGAVRIHTGSAAEHLNQSLQAYAFTYQNHIWLGAYEQLAPSFCLAHELVHVIQQSRPPRMGRHPAPGPESVENLPTHAYGPLVQRVAVYWAPRNRPLRTGKEIQDAIFSDFSPRPEQEVNIPNAARKISGAGAESGFQVKSGRADLYLSEGRKRIGVSFSGEDKPEALPNRSQARPRVYRGKIIKIDEGPKWVKVGEIKPASTEQIKWGKEQVTAYLEGIKLAVTETNKWDAVRDKKVWPLDVNNISPLEPKDIELNPGYTFQTGSPLADEELILAEFSPDERIKRVMDPQKDIGQRVMGGLYVNYYGKGVWAYFARPADPEALVTLPGLTEKRAGYLVIAQQLQNEVVDPITGAPVQPMPLRRPGAKRPTEITHLQAPGRIQRKVKEPPRVRDTFNLKQVKAARERLRGQLAAQEKTRPFQQLRFLELAYEAEEGLNQVDVPKGLPDKSQLTVPLKTRESRPGGKTVTSQLRRPLPTLYSWLRLWTDPKIDTLARFREVFGTTFVTVARKVSAFKEKIQGKLKETFARHAGSRAHGTGYGAIAIRALGRALKAVGEILIPQTLRLVVQSLISGAKERLLKVLPLDVDSLEAAIGNDFRKIKLLIEGVSALKAKIDEKIESIKEDLGGLLSGLKDVLNVASKAASIVKWAVRAIQCGTPPVFGCIKLIFSRLTAWIAEQVLNYCPLQKEIACLVTSIDFVKTGIPMAVAGAITKKFNEALGTIDPDLAPLFAEIDKKDVPPLSCEDIGCEGEPTELQKAYQRLNEALEKRHGFLGAAQMMDSLLEISRKSGFEESDVLTADEVDKLTKVLLLYEVTPHELALLADTFKERTKEEGAATPATVEEFIDAIEKHRAALAAGTTALPAAGEPTQEVSAGGTVGTGEGGGVAAEDSEEGTPSTTAELGGGGGVATVDFSRARFDGKVVKTLAGTRIKVENPDLKRHTAKDVHKVTLVASIDDIPIKRVTNVPVYIPTRFWLPNNIKKIKMQFHYKLLEGVRFAHAVPSVPPLVLEKGTVLKQVKYRGTEQE